MNRAFCSALALSLLIAATTPAHAQQPQPARTVAIFTSKAYVAPNTQEQHFQDTLNLAPGQETLPLTLIVNDGPNGKVPFNWFRINISGYLMASEQDLHGRRQAAIDVTGKLQAGMNQVLIDCAGEPGATLTWSLVTSPVSLTEVEPNQVVPGQAITLIGQNFSPNEGLNKVYVNGQPAQVLASSATAITARVPMGLQQGSATVQVVSSGTETKALPITIGSRTFPVLHSMNYWMAPPGAVLTIRGSNFAPDIAENKVFFRNTAAQVVSASTTRLQVIIPNWGYGSQELNIPVWVVSKGVRSGNYLPFDIGPKYLGALPPMPGDSSSQSSSEASSESGGFPLDATSEATTENSSEASSQQGAEAPFSSEQGSEAGSEAPGPLIFP